MIINSVKKIIALSAILALALPVFSQIEFDRTPPRLPELERGRGRADVSKNPLEKLAPELRTLFEQFAPTRGGEPRGADESGVEGFTSRQLSDLFGIQGGEQNPLVTIAVRFDSQAETETLVKAGAVVIAKTGKTIYAILPVQGLGELSNRASVLSIGVFKAMKMPLPDKQNEAAKFLPLGRGGNTPDAANARLADEFNRQGLTGKGVIIGIIDSGIDWQHKDFIRPDGTSRILALWDIGDNSYQNTNGSVGSEPPVFLEKQNRWLGTVYTNRQINAALEGKDKVNSIDRHGHGTAVAGTAAGNGSATANGVPAGAYAGVAPEADLIVVKASDCGNFASFAVMTSEWIVEKAGELKKPVVVNMSFGGQFSLRDGTDEGEQFIDRITGMGKPGNVFTIAAGNEGRLNLHATGKFGAKRKGQADTLSEPIELFVKEPTRILGTFNAQDDWGLVLLGDNQIFRSVDDKPALFIFYKNNGTLLLKTEGDLKNPKQAESFLKAVTSDFAAKGEKNDAIQFPMPAGNYLLYGFGGTNVTNGNFDLYAVETSSSSKAVFGIGTDKTRMVASPGNAANAITVGSFDFRSSWENLNGERTFYNLELGASSSYTSPGFRRDGVVKPEILSPGRFMISALSEFSKPETGGCQNSIAAAGAANITRDGFHIAWDGTSAATPFTAGVVALMLQKNPTLDAEQVRQILRKTARKDGKVGAVPNNVWGWGMINPTAALRAVPLRAGAQPIRKKGKRQ